MDTLVGVIDGLFSKVTSITSASIVTCHLLVWIDGSACGRRPITTAKLRVLDPVKRLYNRGCSPAETAKDALLAYCDAMGGSVSIL